MICAPGRRRADRQRAARPPQALVDGGGAPACASTSTVTGCQRSRSIVTFAGPQGTRAPSIGLRPMTVPPQTHLRVFRLGDDARGAVAGRRHAGPSAARGLFGERHLPSARPLASRRPRRPRAPARPASRLGCVGARCEPRPVSARRSRRVDRLDLGLPAGVPSPAGVGAGAAGAALGAFTATGAGGGLARIRASRTPTTMLITAMPA